MARNKIGLQVKGMADYMAKLDELGGTNAMVRGVEAALKASKQHVNPKINVAMASSNLPASGKYSKGDTRQSIDTSTNVDWVGTVGKIKVGFDFKKSGLTSIFLMYGTPKMPPVAGLKDAIYGGTTKRQISKIQGATLNKVIKRVLEGG